MSLHRMSAAQGEMILYFERNYTGKSSSVGGGYDLQRKDPCPPNLKIWI